MKRLLLVTLFLVVGVSLSETRRLPVQVPTLAPEPSDCVAGAGACIDSIDITSPVASKIITITGQDLQKEGRTVSDAHSFFSSSSTRYGFEKGPDGASIDNDGYLCTGASCGTEEGWDGDGFYDSDVKLSGSFSAKYRSTVTDGRSGRGGGVGQSYNAILNSNTEDIWWRTAFRLQQAGPDGWPTDYQKFFNSGAFYLNLDPAGRDQRLPDRWLFVHSGRNHPIRYAHRGAGLAADRWYWIECHFKVTRPRAADCWMDDELIYESRPADDAPLKYSLFGVINAESGGPGWDFRIWWDNFLVSSAGRIYPSAVVEVCDKAIYATANCAWQWPVSISDSRIEFTYDQSNVKCAPDCWIYVRNNQQQQSAGRKITSRGR